MATPSDSGEESKEITPPIPHYLSSFPWYIDAERRSFEHGGNRKSWAERPSKMGVNLKGKDIPLDEKIETFELDYYGERDRWDGYYNAIQWYKAGIEVFKIRQLRMLEEMNRNVSKDSVGDDEEDQAK